MIISHEHKFIYIKTIKTASTSIETALCDACGPKDIITPTTKDFMEKRTGGRAQNYRITNHPAVPKIPLWRRALRRPERYYHPTVGYYEHIPGWRVKLYVGDAIWNSYFKFTFERNPWDRQVSFYKFKTQNEAKRLSFDTFNARKKKAYVDNFGLYSLDQEVAMDFVGRYENLQADFSKILDQLNLSGQVTLPHLNVSAGDRKYQLYYSEKSRDLIGDWYCREIKEFGYKF